jgi:four helix bundle protein
MIARRYRELVCWQLANDLKLQVYAFTATAAVAQDRDFYKQIRGSARGGPRAIAEGFGRFRPADFARYLEYARASLIETQNHLDDALDSSYLSDADHKKLFTLADRAIGASTKLHAYLKTCKGPSARNQTGPADPTGKRRPEEPLNQEPRTKNSSTKNLRTQNQEPRTKNEP